MKLLKIFNSDLEIVVDNIAFVVDFKTSYSVVMNDGKSYRIDESQYDEIVSYFNVNSQSYTLERENETIVFNLKTIDSLDSDSVYYNDPYVSGLENDKINELEDAIESYSGGGGGQPVEYNFYSKDGSIDITKVGNDVNFVVDISNVDGGEKTSNKKNSVIGIDDETNSYPSILAINNRIKSLSQEEYDNLSTLGLINEYCIYFIVE